MLLFAVFSLIFGLITAYGGHYDDYYDDHSLDVPIKSYDHGTKVIYAPSHEEKHTSQVEIGPVEMPVHMTFKSKTSPVHVDQKHKKTKGSYKKSHSEDEPHKLVHEVVKPVHQTIKEIIKPYRKVVQVIEPLHEERLTKVHKHSGDRDGGNDRYGGGDDRNGGGYNGGGYNGGGNNGYGRDNNQGEASYNSYKSMSGVFENLNVGNQYSRQW